MGVFGLKIRPRKVQPPTIANTLKKDWAAEAEESGYHSVKSRRGQGIDAEVEVLCGLLAALLNP
jgi:hypothetical protein